MRAEGDRLKVSAPRGALAPELRDELARRKGELLEFLRGAEAAQRPPLPPIGRVPRSGPVPLSFAQRRLWLIHQLEPGSAAYNVPGVLRLRGPLDVPTLVGALRGIVARHEVLRTTFPAAGGVPVQRIHPPSPFPVPLVDLSALPAPDAEAGRLAGEDARRPFDLERGPLLRVALLRLAEDDHAVLLTLHHIVSDGWSVSVFFRELTLLYEAGVRGVQAPLDPLALQYADFAAWQQGWLQGEVLEDQVSWWRQRLAGASPRIDLPPDRQSLGRTSGGAQIDLPLEPTLAAALAGLARSRGASLFMLYLAACQALLFRWTGQSDLSFGSPFAGRNRPEVEGLIGFFVNTLVLRAAVDGEGPFSTLLEQARETVLAAHARQDLPFERLVEELQPERSLDGSPLFQVLFTVHEVTSVAAEVAGLRLEPFPAGLPPAKLDLTLSVTLENGAVVLSATWRPELYAVLTLRRLLEHFRALLAAVAADPEARVSELPLLSKAELHQVAREWNDTDRAYPRDLPLHQLFARQAALHPERAAVLFRGEEIPYGELDARANRLAHHLRALEVGPEDRVAFCLERTPETLVALLAILKAGGAYVPLDPDLPAERLGLLLADCRARVLLTDEASAGSLPALPAGMRRVLLDAEAEAIARRPSTAPPCEVDGDHLAYVMYTSGSTGRPKGVAVLQRGVSRLVLAGGFARFGPEEVFLQLAPLSFDASTLEVWGALLHGACLVLPPERLLAPSELGEVLGAHGVTTLWLTAGLFHQMVEENVEGLQPVRQLLAGGDVLSPPHVRHVLASLPGCRVIDGYGPTEGTTFTCCQPLDDPRDVGDSIPVGRPIGTTRAYVLDRGLRPVPVGVAGELLAGGDGLARGYLDRPDLTAERFVPDPVSGEPGERLYRTGDLVRLRPDGAVEFLGRLDNQVKLRGFRVEPGEIETVLGGHPGVRECAVVVREDQGERRLAAFVVPREEDARGLPAALREHLRSRLPAYMVPPEWTLLDALPLNANGKVDRRALARIASVAEEAAGEAPRTPAEELVAAVWAEVLGRERIHRDDGFFDLGGHSLLAMQMVARLRQVSGVDLPLRRVFEHPSVAGLAAALEAARALGSPAPPLRPVPRTGDLPLSFAQQRLWLIDRLEPGNAAYNIPLAVRLAGSVTPMHLERVFAEVVRRHEALRTTFAEGDGGPVQVIAPELRPEMPMVELSGLDAAAREAEALALAGEEARRPFDLRRGPLLRLALARLGREDHLLLATFHHIVADGWSMGVLLREVAALSTAFSQGEPSALPELPVQYADFAVWQRGWLQGEALEAQLAAWRERLGGAPQTLDLPTDRPPPTRQSFRGAARPAALAPSLARPLRELCRRETATPFMALLAAWAALLGRHAHQEDVLVGTPVAGRHQPETEGLIGFFVNTLVLRTDLSGSPGFGELLRRVRRVSLDAFAHQDLPFERLVEELVPGRDLSRPPLFQVMLALQTAPVGDLEVPGLSFSPVAVESGLAKFELTLSLAEEEGGLAGGLEHNADLFDGTTAERLLARFQSFLEEALADPGRPVDDLPLLLPAERHQVATEWNDTEAGPLGEAPVHELVAVVAREAPEAPAVTAPDGSLTYAELAQRASRLARHLRRLGVGPETRVAVALEHSPERVISLLAVLSAGGAYVSLDPADAPERRAGILEDCGALLLLDSGGIADALEQSSGLSGEWLSGGAGLDHLAYVIYTSGSTGRPKGVEIPHRGLLNLVRWHLATYPTGPGTRAAQVSNPGFDASVWDLWPNLAAGGEVLIPPLELRTDPARLARWLIERGVTISFLPTALAELVLAEPWPATAPLRHLLVGGDRLIQGPPRGLGFSVVNHYGPTEGTVVSTSGRVEPEAPAPPIGRPILNVRAHVVGPDGRLVPAGQGGELWIGGLGLARGYLGRPDLTAERFVPDPFGGEPGARLYRTGDQVRRLSDGRFEFLGRIDHQVKIRGVRIELGEIEAALAIHPTVREAVVVVRERAPGDRRLVAYVVAAPGSADALEYRAFLRRRLPEAMIPSDFLLLEELPLTPNGKIDRARLPAPAGEAAPSVGAAPRTPAEELLAGLWAEVLGRPAVGTDEDFFALGGHSLLATRLLSRVRAATGAEVALRDLFEAPTVAGLAVAVERARGAGRFQAPPLERVERAGPLPLSFAQQRLWFLDRLTPGSAAYNVPLGLRLEGELDVPALRSVFAGIARRHEILRTTFEERDGEPVQVIHAPAELPLPVIDLAALSESVRDREARELIRAETLLPFDLARGPLFRGALVRLAGTDHLLLATFHHIVSDGWSVGVVVRELESLYAGSPLPELPVQYGDFAVWQRSWLRGEVLEAEIAFWRERLAGAPALLDLPTDRPRPPVQSERGASAPLDLPPSLAGRLEALGRAEGATQFMVVLATFQTLLSRWARREDVSVGTPVAGRDRLEVERLIGFFVNILVLRADLSGDPPWRELLSQVRRSVLDAHAHQDVPFEKLVEELAPERSLGHAPLFQVMLNLQTASGGSPELPGLRSHLLDPGGTPAKFDLNLALARTEEGFGGGIEYAADLFDATTIQRLLGQLTRLLEEVAADPGRRLSELPLLAESERHQLLREWNDTGAGSGEACLHELFERQASRTPDAVALIAGTELLLYRELDERAERLAERLRELGVGPESRVAVHLRRSAEMVVALLAVLKAGGAYVPIDPAYPPARVEAILEDARPVAVITEEGLREELPAPDLPAGEVTPDHLAYVIFTSGSTGRPKGVAITHRSAAVLLAWARDVFPLEDLDRVLFATSICFDLSVFELFLPLSRGGAVVLAENALALPDLPAADEVTLVNTVPSAIAELVASRGLPPSVRTVNLAGEALRGSLVRRIYEIPTVRRVLNLYGPSEDTTYSTWAPMEKMEREASREPAIGRPVAGTQAWLVDRHGQAVPTGAAGELMLSGAGLARGYLGRPDLTAERFLPNPFGEGPGDRLYRTGDLARYRADGSLDYLGRLDHQVKVRGFRIELGEIEAALASLPGVREAVVLAREDRLVAWVAGASLSATDLRNALAARLPGYMVPSAIVVLDALPLTPNGKVDRKALPSPYRETGGAAPRTPLEELLAGLWAEVLDRETVGREEDFFALGGHSLLATRLLSRLRSAAGVEVSLRELFEAPTVAGLAAVVERARGAGRPVPPPLVPVERGGPLPLSFAQQRLWFLDRLSPASAAYNIPLGLVLEGELEMPALARALEKIVDRHESLRTTFGEADGMPVQVIQPPGVPALPVIDLEGLGPVIQEEEARRLTREEMLRPFDLARGPLFRTTLIRLKGAEHLFLAVFHHIVSDGWSLGVLVQELEALWSGAPLPDLPVQYGDFAVWQRSWLQGEALEAEIAFWRERLAGAPALLDLSTDRPRPAVQSERGASALVELPASLADRLEALGRSEGATLFMVLLATFQTLLARWSGREDVSVGTPVAGRGRLEVEGLIGFFVNTLVQRTDLSGDPSWRELLARVRHGVLDAYARQDVPFEKLVEELAPERSLGHAPLFQVMLNLQTAPAGAPELPGLRTRVIDPEEAPAKYDLSLALGRTEEGLSGLLEYAADLFDRTTIQRLLGQLARLLEEVTADPGRRLSELPLLGASERHQLLVEWNDTGAGTGEACLHELFERQAACTPEAVALIAGTERLLYRELDERAERLAGRLRALGVGPEARVAVHMRRSPEMVVALLAVLKAGGAYVPIDPAYPPARVEAILEDSRPVAVLTEEGQLPAPELPARKVDPDHLAYVIFTSGSTGRPKGVAITHRSAAVLLAWAREVFPVEDLHRVLFATSICFDLSVFELFLPLSCGGAVVLAENALALPDLPAAAEVTLINTVPSALAELVASRGLPPSVRTVNLAGEPLRGSLVRRIYEIPTVRRVLNLYGPSEDTTYSTWTVMDREILREPAIGRPVAGTQSWLVDPHGQPVPLGAAGELRLSGAGLARGYLGRPDLTAEHFLPNPFGERPGDRLYRTGDLARYRADGSLDYLGRLDHQVKVRGFRIELGEIEAALGTLPGIREAVVVAREERLVAWVAGASLSAAELRSALAERLPGYMVPSAIVALDALPLTPNGKVDRKALPAPEAATADRPSLPPRDALELELVRIWSEVLRRPVGITDSFFDLGGHSLLAVQLLARVEGRFGRRLPLTGLFAGPTVERQAGQLRGEGDGEAFRALVPLETRGEEPPFFCVHAVGGGVFAYLELARRLGRPFYGLQAPPPDAPVTVESLAARYLEEVRQRQPRGPYFLGGWSMGATVAFEMVRLLREAGEEIAVLALLEPSSVRRPGETPGPEPSPESLFDGFVRDLSLQGQTELAQQAGEPLGRALFETFRANLQALQAWRPAPYDGPAHLFLAGPSADTRGWEEVIRGGLTVSLVPGDHYSFLREPNLPHLAEQLRGILRAGSSTSEP